MPYYDEDFDWPLIVSSFAMQYGIRLEREDLPYSEYVKLLAGIMWETPLGEVVRIRSESDPKTIKSMSAHEKKVRAEWQAFLRQKKNADTSRAEAAGLAAFAAFAKSAWG